MLGVNPRATHERTHRGECAPDLGAQEERDRNDGGDHQLDNQASGGEIHIREEVEQGASFRMISPSFGPARSR